MNNKDLWNIEVTDRESFQEFLGLLILDLKNNPENWENNKLDLYIEAMQSYTEDLDGYYKNNHPELNAEIPKWKTFADILRGAIVYE